MSFSIDEFWKAVEGATAQFTDFRRDCAREVAQLNLDPLSRLSESSFFGSLQQAGVPRDAVNELRRAWKPQFNNFRSLARMTEVRTPPLMLFKVCAESVANRFDRPLGKALAGQWLKFAVGPTEKQQIDELLSKMERYRIDPEWTARLKDTWTFLFEPGGHSDMDRRAPSVYYEIYDEAASHVSIVNPVDEVDEGRDGESALDTAMELLSRHPVLLISDGEPDAEDGLAHGLKEEMEGDGVTVVDMMDAPLDAEDVKASFDELDPVSLIMTQESLVAAGDGLKDYIRGDYFVPNSPDRNPFVNPLRTLVIFAERSKLTRKRAGAHISTAMGRLGLTGEVPAIVARGRMGGSEPLIMPNGNWRKYMDVLRAHAADNFVTIGPCQAPFKTFMLPIV